MHVQSTITTDTGAIIPAICDQRTPLDMLPAYVDALHAASGATVALDTVRQVVDAMRDSAALVVLYADAKAEVAARVLWPVSVGITKDKNLTARAYDTKRREYRSFRLDRMVSVHELSTPDDAEPQAKTQAVPDPARILSRAGSTIKSVLGTATLDAVDMARLNDALDDCRRAYRVVATA